MLASIKLIETGTKENVKQFVAADDTFHRDMDNNTLLHYACLAGNLASTEALLERGFHVNAANCEGHTPICDAAINGSADLIRLLLANGANANPPAYWGSPLSYAVRNGHFEAVVALIEGGADINACDRIGACPIHIAIKQKLYECLDYLLMSGANPNIRIRLTTPLHMAAKLQDSYLVRLLLCHGAQSDPVDSTGATPLDLVPKDGELYHLLKSYVGWVPSLQFIVRLSLRRFLVCLRKENVASLNLPKHLSDYVTFKF